MRNAPERLADRFPEQPIVCYVTDGRQFPVERRNLMLNECVSEAIRAGADWIQIREKDVSGRSVLALTRQVSEAAKGAGGRQKIVVNDRLDVACAVAAFGVHLGGESLPIREAATWRRQALEDFRQIVIGASCHSLEEVLRAEAAGADYVFFGPVFGTPSKRVFGPPQGLTRLAEACNATTLPVIAIGGIDDQNAIDCLSSGAVGIAAIRFFQELRDASALAIFVDRVHAFKR